MNERKKTKSNKRTEKSKNIKNIIIVIILAVAALGYFYYLSNRNTNEKALDANTTEVSKILAEDLSKTYPETPRGVIKFYNRILRCFYNEEYTEDELTGLGLQARELFDQELLVTNPEENYFKNLKAEIKDYADNNRNIFSIKLTSSDNVEYYTVEEREYSIVYCTYSLNASSGVSKLTHKYMLRKDENGQWKILGWELSTNEVTEGKNEE